MRLEKCGDLCRRTFKIKAHGITAEGFLHALFHSMQACLYAQAPSHQFQYKLAFVLPRCCGSLSLSLSPLLRLVPCLACSTLAVDEAQGEWHRGPHVCPLQQPSISRQMNHYDDKRQITPAEGNTMRRSCNTDLSATASSMNSLPVRVAAVQAAVVVDCILLAGGGVKGTGKRTPSFSATSTQDCRREAWSAFASPLRTTPCQKYTVPHYCCSYYCYRHR